MTLDEVIKEFTDWAKDNRKEQNFWAAERDENDETNPLSYADCEGLARDAETRAEYHEQLAEWLTELKDLREENKVLTSECDRLIKEKGELLKKSESITEYKRLLKIAVADMGVTVAKVYNGGLICECCKWKSQMDECCCPDDRGCDVVYRWRHADEALKLIES